MRNLFAVLEFFSVLKKVADKSDLVIHHFQYGDAFIPVGFISSAAAFVCPVNGGIAAFTDYLLNLKR